MPLERVRVKAVRCLKTVDVELHPVRNYFFGANGAGKTSFLEAIHLVGRGRSFRTRQTARLVANGAKDLGVSGVLRDALGPRELTVRFDDGHLEAEIDAKRASLIELAQALPVHVIDPERHELIEAGPSVRRRYLDSGVFHVEPRYLETWREYRRILAQRNSALRQARTRADHVVWDDALARSGTVIHDHRAAYMARLSQSVGIIGARLLGRELIIDYKAGWRRGLSLAEALRESKPRDLETRYTQVGPHRADLELRLGDSAIRNAASRGQQKLVVAALILAQVAVFADVAGYGGTLLVDDPAAELDSAALARLSTELLATNAQLVITGLSSAGLKPQPGFPMFHVEQGIIEPML